MCWERLQWKDNKPVKIKEPAMKNEETTKDFSPRSSETEYDTAENLVEQHYCSLLGEKPLVQGTEDTIISERAEVPYDYYFTAQQKGKYYSIRERMTSFKEPNAICQSEIILTMR